MAGMAEGRVGSQVGWEAAATKAAAARAAAAWAAVVMAAAVRFGLV